MLWAISLSLSLCYAFNEFICTWCGKFFSLGIFNFSSSVHVICVVMGDTVALNPPPPKEYPYYYYYYYYYYYFSITSNIMLNYNRQDKKLYVTSQLCNDNYSNVCHTSLFGQSNVSRKEIHKRGHVRPSICKHALSRQALVGFWRKVIRNLRYWRSNQIVIFHSL
jgi:aminopeptidase-like protein